MRQYLFHHWNFQVRASTDTTFSSLKSVRVNKACKIFVTNFGGVKVYPSNNKGDDHMVLSKYFKYIGVSTSIHMDNSKYMDVSNKRNKILDE